MTRHWSINGRFLGQSPAGPHRYALEIVRALDTRLAENHPLSRDVELELLIPDGVASPPELSAIQVRKVSGGHGYIWEQTSLPIACKGGLISLCNVGPLAKRRHIVCIHDVNTRLAPESYTARFRLSYSLLMPALGRTARVVTTVSQFSAGQLARFGICRPEKIRVIPNGHEHALRFRPSHSSATLAASGRDTIVVVGGEAPYKNVRAILSMAHDLEEMGLRIAVVGTSNPLVFRQDYERSSWPAGNIVWLGRIEDSALAALLGDCLCLAFPSLTEGFGLPPIEAMALGCPVVVSDRGSLPEVCGPAALLAPPLERDVWLRHFRSLARDDRLRANLIACGRLQASRFRWSDSALSYLHAMAQVDASA